MLGEKLGDQSVLSDVGSFTTTTAASAFFLSCSFFFLFFFKPFSSEGS